MKNENTKYIIFDLDETLLDENREVTAFTKSTLDELRAKGKIIVINTARSLMFAKKYIEAIDPDYAILNGGALIVDRDGRIIYEKKLTRSDMDKLLPRLLELSPSISLQSINYLYTNDPSFTRWDTKRFDFVNNKIHFDVYKILTHFSEEEQYKLSEGLGLLCTPYLDGRYQRLNHKDATKHKGNIALLSLLGTDISETIVFGDDFGDIEMINKAGHGVIMKSARDEALALCHANVSDFGHTENGVARYLRSYFGID